jgi:putative transposase
VPLAPRQSKRDCLGHPAFQIYSRQKLEEKLTYIHQNPVRAGLVDRAADWRWSSARHYEDGRTVGVPITWVY